MAEQVDRLLNALSVQNSPNESTPDDDDGDDGVRLTLNDIETDCESIFSWRIYERTGFDGLPLESGEIREWSDLIVEKENKFNPDKFYFQLVSCFALYNSKRYEESLQEIEDIVKSTTLCTTDETYGPYSNAFDHVARSTHAYIALSMNHDAEKIVANVKSTENFNKEEKSAICAIKAYVFLKYAPKGNDIALGLAELACDLHPAEPEWIFTWLKAKGRVRRYYKKNGCPDNNELDVTEILMNVPEQKSKFCNHVSGIYFEIASFYRNVFNNSREFNRYAKKALDYLNKAILLEENQNDKTELTQILISYIRLPKYLHSKSQLDKLVQRLQSVNESYLTNFTLGKYYYTIEKNYELAKMYYSRAMADNGTFQYTMELFKVDCLLQSDNEQFSVVDTLNLIYDNFLHPKRRLTILSQILFYYYYFNQNPKEVMRYLKLYMDQDIGDSFKKETLVVFRPTPYHRMTDREPSSYNYYKVNYFFKRFTTFVTDIANNYEWNDEEKTIVRDTFERFNKMISTSDINNKTCRGENNNLCENNGENYASEKRFVRRLQRFHADRKPSWHDKKKQDFSEVPELNVGRDKTADRKMQSGLHDDCNVNNGSAGSSNPDESNHLTDDGSRSNYCNTFIFGPRRNPNLNTKSAWL